MRITRRDFLVTGAAVAAAPMLLGLTDKSGSKPPILGQGDHQYDAIHDWGELPRTIKYGNTHGVCEDSQGNIYIHHTVHATSDNLDTMVVFDHEGKFVRSWGRQFKGGAHGLTIRKEGSEEFLYLCDYQHGIVSKRTLKGEEVWTLGYPAESEAYKPKDKFSTVAYRPTNVAIAPNGDIYVGDGYGSSFINQYNSKAEFIRTFGGFGKADDQLDCPHGLWIDTRGDAPLLVVTDRGNSRLQRFTLEGHRVDSIVGTSKMPCNLYERNGEVVIPDLLSKVIILDRKNNVIVSLGEGEYSNADWATVRNQSPGTFVPGRFVCPHGACFDHEGNIFVVEWVESGRVTKLRHVS
jgi:TAT (twin-arginine translocation) pathway signal sequence